VREMSISENYEGEITPIRSNISRFSRGTVGACDFEVHQIIKCKKRVLEELAKNVEAIGK